MHPWKNILPDQGKGSLKNWIEFVYQNSPNPVVNKPSFMHQTDVMDGLIVATAVMVTVLCVTIQRQHLIVKYYIIFQQAALVLKVGGNSLQYELKRIIFLLHFEHPLTIVYFSVCIQVKELLALSLFLMLWVFSCGVLICLAPRFNCVWLEDDRKEYQTAKKLFLRISRFGWLHFLILFGWRMTERSIRLLKMKIRIFNQVFYC